VPEPIIVKVEGGLVGAVNDGTASGASSGLGAAAGSIGRMAAGVAIGVGMLGVIKGGITRIAKAQPQLRATFELLGKTFDILLRPIGDIMLLFIKPLAIGMLRLALPMYIAWRKWLMENEGLAKTIAELLGGPLVTLLGQIGDFLKGFNEGGLAGGFEALEEAGKERARNAWGLIKDVGLWLWGNFKEGWAAQFELIAAGWELMTELIGAWYEGFIEFWSETVPELWGLFVQGFTVFFSETLPLLVTAAWAVVSSLLESMWNNIISFFGSTFPNAVNEMWENIITFFTETFPSAANIVWDNILVFFTETLPEGIEGAWETIKTFFTETVVGWIVDGWDGVKDFFTEELPSWITTLIDKLYSAFETLIEKAKSILSEIDSWLNSLRKYAKKFGLASGGYISETGMYELHAGEYVVRAGDVSAGKAVNQGPSFNTSITINGSVNNRSDANAIAEQIERRLTEKWKRELQFKSTYARGS
jgi:phage-related protein